MKLQLRLIILLLILFLAGATILAIQRDFDVSHSRHILASELQQRKTYFDNIVNLDGQSLNTLSVDYSFWDDFVNFIKTDDLTFAHENLDTGLATFNTDADWVYRPNGSLLYWSTLAPDTNVPKNLNLPAAFFNRLRTSKFAHFYMRVSGGVLEIRAATIVPGDDTNHLTPARGFWLVGRLLGSSYTSGLAQLSQSSVSLKLATASPNGSFTANTVSFGSVLRNWDSAPVAVLHVASRVSLIDGLNHVYGSELGVLAAFAIAIIVLIACTTWLFVLRPLRLITMSITQKRPDILGELGETTTEFGSLATTVQGFFQQQTVIAASEVHKQALEKRSQENAAFVATTAHGLGEPIANIHQSVSTMSVLLQKQAPAAEFRHQLDSINSQLVRAAVLLDDFRSASEGQATLRFNLQDLDIGTFLQNEVDLAKSTVKQQLVFSTDTHLYVRGDPDRLGQALTDLIRHVAQRSPESGVIEINTKAENNQAIVAIWSHALSTPPQTQQHVLAQPPQSGSTADSKPDAAPDLQIAKQIVGHLGGKLWTAAIPDNGTCFYMSLPGIARTSGPESFTVKA